MTIAGKTTLSKFYPDFILILSRFFGNSHYQNFIRPDFIWIRFEKNQEKIEIDNILIKGHERD